MRLIAPLLPLYCPFNSSITQFEIAQLQSNENQPIDEQQSLSQIPWTHHIIILDKAKTLDERIFYIKEVIRNAWSITMLKINIETCLYKRKGDAITEQELGREMETMLSPTEEKKSKAKDILAAVKGQEINKAKQ